MTGFFCYFGFFVQNARELATKKGQSAFVASIESVMRGFKDMIRCMKTEAIDRVIKAFSRRRLASYNIRTGFVVNPKNLSPNFVPV